MAWKHILCPIDFSGGAGEALSVAVTLAQESGATLQLAHVWQAPFYTLGEGAALAGDLLTELRRDAEARLVQAKADAERMGATQVSTRLIDGVAWHEIVEVAKQDPAIDLIVMGTHGRTGLKHVLIGSVAEKVVRHAPCTVLVFRARA